MLLETHSFQLLAFPWSVAVVYLTSSLRLLTSNAKHCTVTLAIALYFAQSCIANVSQ